MKHIKEENESELKLGYYWKHKTKWNKLEALVSNQSTIIKERSEEEFIAEHYWGYSKYNETTFEYKVQHPRWEIYPLKEYSVSCDFEALYGKRFAFLQHATSSSVFIAKGSAISVLSKRKL